MRLVLAAILIFVPLSVGAEIEKLALSCETGMCLYWWPKLPPVKRWHHEPGPSQHYGANTLAPDGSTFMDAETVIYAKASYKPRMPQNKSLKDFVTNDHKDFKKNVPGLAIVETKPLLTGDGKQLKSYTFVPVGQGNWERVTYGEEGEFYLIFTISSRTKDGYEKAIPTYEAMIRRYKEKL